MMSATLPMSPPFCFSCTLLANFKFNYYSSGNIITHPIQPPQQPSHLPTSALWHYGSAQQAQTTNQGGAKERERQRKIFRRRGGYYSHRTATEDSECRLSVCQ